MARGRKSNLFINFLTSGKAENPDVDLRYSVFNLALLAGGTFLIVFGISVYMEGNLTRALADYFVGTLCFATIGFLRTRLPLQIPAGVAIGAFGILCVLLISTGQLNGIAGLWTFAFPIIAIFILGLGMGLIYSVLVFLGLAAYTIVPELAAIAYSPATTTRLLAVYFLISFLAVIYEQIRLIKDRRVNQLNQELRVERDLITAMKDNLKIGLFLMDRELVIQGAYSKPLETILGTDEIEGKKLTGFLSSSLKSKEQDTLEDYFNMVLTRQFDIKMLEEINPIAEFTYVDEINNEEKILRTAFSPVDMGKNDYFVMGSVEDISATKKLERQLAEEASRREEEMRALFQVIQVDSAVFGDFIEDTEYEFDSINNTLKNTTLTAKDAMVDIYQSVHAIKSNAIILGLENFSTKLHQLENTIKKFRDSDEVTFENVLHVAVELEKLMKEKDKFRDITNKIDSFRTNAGDKDDRQDQYVLIETLTKACKKASEALERQVDFTVDQLDASILEKGPRRVIKEVLTQLVRNSVYHGIEAPEERKTFGKKESGLIRLSVIRENNQIHLKLSDDGRGLDFEKIREKALKQNILRKENANDKNLLIQALFSPGFSTAESADLHAGRGIGLNLVRERIKQLHGTIKVSSEAGKGTVFHLFIPD
jgi:two-component system chemotaxis sensor kinase CheA